MRTDVAVGLLVAVLAVACGTEDRSAGPTPQRLHRVSGDQQRGTVGTTLPLPLVVLVEAEDGTPSSGRVVTFSIVVGDARLSCEAAVTDSLGMASTRVTLGDSTGAVRVEAATTGIDGAVEFTATAVATDGTEPTTDQPLVVALVAGDEQTGAVGTLLPVPLSVQLTRDGVPQAGVTVAFAVLEGDARLTTDTSLTDDSGLASVQVVLGGATGVVRVSASAAEAQQAALFVLHAELPSGDSAIELTAVGGDGQTGIVGTLLPAPLVVSATANGVPLRGIRIAFDVAEGDARVTADAALTDDDGLASVQVVLGSTAGVVLVLAAAEGALAPATFQLHAVLTPAPGEYALRFTAAQFHEVDVGLVATGGDQYTAEAWVRPDPEMLTREVGSIIGQHASYVDCKGTLDLLWGHLRLSITTVTGFHEVRAPEPLPTDRWVHVAGTYDGQYARLYQNARLVAALPMAGVMTAYNQRRSTRIGGYAGTMAGEYWFSGAIDEVRVWSVVRSPEQLRAAMLHPIDPEAGLAGYWRFDEGMGATTADLSEYGHHGRLTSYAGTGLPQWVPGVFAQIDPAADW